MLPKVSKYLGTQIDNSPLIFFRVCYGFLVFMECAGAIVTGWVERAFIIPSMTFTFIGFEWLQPLPGDGMYYYYGVMALCGLLIMVGLFYRGAATLFFVLWTATYFMQKTNYNNHYYLLVLLSGAMALMPANKYASLDVRLGFTRESLTCARAWITFFIAQILIVYLFASYNKIYPGWLNAEPISIWFSTKKDYWLIGDLLQKTWFHYLISYGGIVYDGTIVFLLLYKPTRKLGFVLSVIFNLFNSAIFQIGIFPYMMIALSVLFFPEDDIRRMFFKKKPTVEPKEQYLPNFALILFSAYFVLQLFLPLRHYLYKGDVFWTEEGHRMAWQMMLYSKRGYVKFKVIREDGTEEMLRHRKYLTGKQSGRLAGHPDMVWQFVQFLEREVYPDEDVQIFVEGKCKLNKGEFRRLIDPEVDLTQVDWKHFEHADWILTYED